MKIGDIVSLNSNKKVKMTVSEVLVNHDVVCVWINKTHTLSEGTFAQSMLLIDDIKERTPEERVERIKELTGKAKE